MRQASTIIVCAALFLARGFAQDQSIGRPVYRIALNDRLLIRIPQSEKLDNRVFQVDSRGFVNLPSIGRVRASGLSLQVFEKELSRRLKGSVPGEPQVSVSEVTLHR